MFNSLLILHSLTRWLVLIALVSAIINAFLKLRSQKPYSKSDNFLRVTTLTITHIQFTIGLVLYFVSPIVDYFLRNFKEAVHIREMRFFGMEHITMMVIAVTIVTIGSAKAKKRQLPHDKHKTIAVWFLIALVIIFLSIPWQFSPFTARPYWRF
jgi:cytochrome c biogenesis factor